MAGEDFGGDGGGGEGAAAQGLGGGGMPVVHAVAEAVAEGGTVAAASFPRPRAVAERLETAAPHFP